MYLRGELESQGVFVQYALHDALHSADLDTW